MTDSTSSDLVDFALRTGDIAWIKRHNGRTDDAGRVIVGVPAGEIDAIELGGTGMLRHVFADCPSDAPNGAILCPAAYVPATAARYTFKREGIPSAVLEFMRRPGRR
jgi:hypothetical protein